MWWRQNYDPSLISYLFHTITGCEDKSHTEWTMVNEGYAFNKVNPEGLWCCHNGPANCYCDITQYVTCSSYANEQCLTADYDDGSVSLRECGPMYTDATTWRETFYNETFIQIENWGTTGPNMPNTYMCLGQDHLDKESFCRSGTSSGLVSCYTEYDRMNLFQWVNGRIRAMNCQNDLCLTVGERGEVVLEYCDKASVFKRLTGHDKE